MQGFIQSGATWMQPLARFRNWLKDIREVSANRSPVTRNGQNKLGPFTPKAHQMILEELLKTEHETGLALISDEEIAQIQAQWQEDFDYSESAYTIARKYGREVTMKKPVNLAPEEEKILEELAVEFSLNPEIAREMLDLTRKLDADQEQALSLSRPEYVRALGRLVEQVAAQAEGATSS